jgi:hypothetical protein
MKTLKNEELVKIVGGRNENSPGGLHVGFVTGTDGLGIAVLGKDDVYYSKTITSVNASNAIANQFDDPPTHTVQEIYDANGIIY